MKQASRGPLHKAAISGQYETVKMLLESGDDVDLKDQVLVFPGHCKSNACGFLHSFLKASFEYNCIFCVHERTQHSDWPVITGQENHKSLS